MRYGLYGVLSAVVIFTAGCGAHSHRLMGTAMDNDEVISRVAFDQPMPGRYGHLVIAQTLIGESPAVEEGGEVNEEYNFPVEAFDRTLGEIFQQSGAFQTITLLDEEGDPIDGEGPPELGLLVQFELDKQSLAFVSRNTNMGLGLGIWLTGVGFPAQWVHDGIFRIEFEGQAEILDYSTNESLASVNLGVCELEEALNFHERTSSVVPYLLTNLIPPTVIGSDPASLMESLLPRALGEALVRMRDAFVDLAEAMPPDAIRVWRGVSDSVEFQVHSPEEGSVPTGNTVDLNIDLVLARGSSDLIRVIVNDDIILGAGGKTEEIPSGSTVPLEVKRVSFVDGLITVSVLLNSEPDPVVTEIVRPQK